MWNIPNLMSIVRLILAPVAAFLIYYDYQGYAIFALVIAGSFDILDGIIARKYNLVTEFGKLIDPLADKAMYALVLIAMVLTDQIVVWYVLLFILRDVLILIGTLSFSSKVHEIPQADKFGKLSIFINAMSIFLIICGVKEINGIFLLIPLILLYLSTINYILKGMDIIKNQK